jgi:hypothetical protein
MSKVTLRSKYPNYRVRNHNFENGRCVVTSAEYETLKTNPFHNIDFWPEDPAAMRKLVAEHPPVDDTTTDTTDPNAGGESVPPGDTGDAGASGDGQAVKTPEPEGDKPKSKKGNAKP